MCISTTLRLAFISLVMVIAAAGGASAQMCIGSTTYVVRDATGRVMTAEQMRAIDFRSVDGLPLRLSDSVSAERHYTGEWLTHYYRDTVMVGPMLRVDNPLPVGRVCGRISELTLALDGKVMRLLFDIDQHNTSFEIDSPPFQEGTFHLRSPACADGARPPLIDNRTTGKCRVAAENWEGMDKDWVRHLVLRDFNGGQAPFSADSCRSLKPNAVTTPTEFAGLWSAYSTLAGRNPIPLVDFRTSFVLIAYLPRGTWFNILGVQVDKRGDLTLVTQPHPPASSPECSVVLIQLPRSGVSSIGGRPLPPPGPLPASALR
jgi:hypothetical protein